LSHPIARAAQATVDVRAIAVTPDAIVRAIAQAVELPLDVDVGTLIVRPTRSTI